MRLHAGPFTIEPAGSRTWLRARARLLLPGVVPAGVRPLLLPLGPSIDTRLDSERDALQVRMGVRHQARSCDA